MYTNKLYYEKKKLILGCGIVTMLLCNVLGIILTEHNLSIENRSLTTPTRSQFLPSDIAPSLISTPRQKNYTDFTDGDSISISAVNPITNSNIYFENITVDNISLVLEPYAEDPAGADSSYDYIFFQEIRVPASCYIPWVSLYVQHYNQSSDPVKNWTVSVFNATIGFPNPLPTPDREVKGTNVTLNPLDEDGVGTSRYFPHWENITMANVLLNSSQTVKYQDNYVFFLAVFIQSYKLFPPTDLSNWYYSNDTSGIGMDSGLAYASPVFPGYIGPDNERIRLATVELPDIDFTVITELTPVNRTPKPSDIGLKVNGQPVQDISNGSGIYNNTIEQLPQDGIVEYDISSSWSEFSEGSLEYDAVINYNLGQDITPTLTNMIYGGNSTVSWNLSYDVQFNQPNGLETAVLDVEIPLSWYGVELFNTTNGNNSIWPFSLVVSQNGKFQQLTAYGLTPGSWEIGAISDLETIDLSINLVNQSIDLEDNLTGLAEAIGGQNGENENLRTDFDGRISNITTLIGDSNTTSPEAILNLDQFAIQFFNNTALGLEEVEDHFSNSTFMDNYSISNMFDLYFNLDEGFSEENLENIELLLDHESMPGGSWWYANLTNASMPANNPTWNSEPVTLSDAFDRLLFYDFSEVSINWTYNISEERFSDFYLNYTLSVFDQYIMNRSDITGIVLEIVVNFSYFNTNFDLLIKNQTSENFIPVNDLKRQKGYVDQTILIWDSKTDTAIENLTDFIIPGKNEIEFIVRPYNQTYFNYTNQDWVDISADMAAINFTYRNKIENYTLWIYNWTSGNYADMNITFSGQYDYAQQIISLNSTFASLEDLFDENENRFRIIITGTAEIPMFNQVKWNLNRLLGNLTYIQYSTFSWNESIIKESDQSLVHSEITETLFDSPTNNFTVFQTLKDKITSPEKYEYILQWTNGTDYGINSKNFTINPFGTDSSFFSGARWNGSLGLWELREDYKPYVNDSKSFIIYVEDTVFNNPVSEGIITTNWTGPNSPTITDLYVANGNDDAYAGRYEVNLDTTGMNATYSSPIHLLIEFNKSFYIGSNLTLLVDILPIPVTILPAPQSISLFENRSIDFSASMYDPVHSTQLTDLEVNWTILEMPSINGTMDHLTFGVYQGNLDLGVISLAPGNYTLDVQVGTFNIAETNKSLLVNVLDTIPVSIFIIEEANIQYRTGEQVEVIAGIIDSNGTNLSGFILEMAITADLREGGDEIVSLSAVTDATGKATFRFNAEISWKTFNYVINFNAEDPSYAPGTISSSLTNDVSVMDDLEYYLSLLVTYSPYIIGIIAFILIIAVVRKTNQAKRRKNWKKDADKIKDIIKIQHMLVIMKSSGACIVNRAYSSMQLDGDLISGFLQAITTFGKEVGPAQKKKSSQGIIFDYQDFKILIQDGTYARLALILDGVPTESLKQKAGEFIKLFEQQYNLAKWRGNLEIFNAVDNLIEQVFEITLIYPLVVDNTKTIKDVKDGLQKALFEVGEAVQQEKGAFYLATLVNFAQAGRKESQDHVLSAIYNLKKNGFFTFYSPEQATT